MFDNALKQFEDSYIETGTAKIQMKRELKEPKKTQTVWRPQETKPEIS